MACTPDCVAALAAGGANQTEIARELGVSRQRVHQIVRQHGITLLADGRLKAAAARAGDSTALRAKFMGECEGMTAAEAAERLGVTTATVYRYAKVCGRKTRAAYPARNKRTPTTERILAAAPELAAKGMSKTEAAKALGVPPATLIVAAHTYLPDLIWRDGRRKEFLRRCIGAAPAMAAKGLSRSEAARKLGVPPPAFRDALRRHLPDLTWTNGRGRKPKG